MMRLLINLHQERLIVSLVKKNGILQYYQRTFEKIVEIISQLYI